MQFYNDKFKAFRITKEITVSEIAKYLDVSHATVSCWQTGVSEPNKRSVLALAYYFDINPSDISDIPDRTDRTDRTDKFYQKYINERRNKEIERKKKVFFKKQLDLSDSYKYVKDREFKIKDVNNAFYHLTGSTDNLIGTTFTNIFKNCDLSKLIELEQNMFRHGIIKPAEIRDPINGGWWLVSGEVFEYDDNGTPQQIFVKIKDITEEKKINDLNISLATALSKSGQGFFIANENTLTYNFCNNKYYQIHDITPEESAKNPLIWQNRIRVDYRLC
jgi:PAS domain S-box-containing protein